MQQVHVYVSIDKALIKQEEMRDHLLARFERKEITPFPSKTGK